MTTETPGIDWMKVKAFVDAAYNKGCSVPSRPRRACQCGRMVKLGATGQWNCGPACMPPPTTSPPPPRDTPQDQVRPERNMHKPKAPPKPPPKPKKKPRKAGAWY